MQALVTFAREQNVYALLVGLPAGDKRSRHCGSALSGRAGDFHVMRIEIAIADDTDLTDGFERLTNHFKHVRRADNARADSLANEALDAEAGPTEPA